MNGFRKTLLVLLGIVLFGSLLGVALSTSAKMTIYNPDKVEQWISQSKLYDHFVSTAAERGQAAVGSTSENDNVTSLSDTAVQDAAKTAFSKQLVEQSINSVIESNYAWLRGETDTPEFKIDLTGAKQSFAQEVGAYVTTSLSSLPVCTNAQLAQMQNVDPLSMTCRPSNVDPKTAGQQVTQQIIDSDELLSNTVLTAQTINPDPTSQSDPYYEKFSQLPKAYQFSEKLPYIFAGLTVLSALVFILLFSSRRNGIKWTAIILTVAGLLLVTTKLTSDLAFKQLENRVFNTSSDGEVQKSLTSFFHQIESASTTIQMYFGIAFLLLAIVLFFVSRTRKEVGPTEPNLPPISVETPKPATKAATPRIRTNKPTTQKPATSPKPKKRPPRLVQ